MVGPLPSPATDPEHAARMAWVRQVKGLHRNKRLLGLAGIIAGAGVLMWWKLRLDAPEWSLWVGAGLLGASWALFAYIILARWQWVKRNPYRSHT